MGHRRLKFITTPIKRHLSGQAHTKKLKLVYQKGVLAPPLQVAFFRGEGLLKSCFFVLMEKMNFHNPERQLELWQLLVINPGYLLDFLQRIGLYSQIEHDSDMDSEVSCFHLYCILLDSLSQQANNTLLSKATDEFFRFHIYGLYPKKEASPKKNTAEQLKHKVLLKLRKNWGGTAELKESFITTDEQVDFKLRLKVKNYSWQTLIELQGERLKSARLDAYNQLLAALEKGRHHPDSVYSDAALKPVASDSIKPLIKYK